jgi:tetratricopeptide (TPR) repeat protein
MRSWILGLCLVLASLGARPAFADGNAKAKQLYDEGFRHFNVAEYPQAIESWKQAYLISKKPLLLFNIAQAYRLSGDCKQAMTFYDNYQNSETSIKNQDELDQAIAACKAADAKPADAKPVEPKPVEPKPIETTPAITTPPTPPITETHPIAPPPVQQTPVQPAPPPAEPTASSNSRRQIGLIVGIAGVVAEGGAVLFALQGKAKASDAENVAMWDQHAMDLQSAGQRDNKLAWGFGIAGGAAIAAGVVLYVTGGASAEHGVAIVPTRGGAQVGWAHSF